MNYLSICAIAKNEAPYIWEWVRYHLGVGVEHIYLYNNDSADLTVQWAKKAGGDDITIVNTHGSGMQIPVYHACLAQHRQHTRWLSFLDCDEFIVPMKVDDIKEILPAYEKYPGLCPHWLLFGSNGHKFYEAKPVTERFTKCDDKINQFVKSIVDPTRTIRASSPTNSHKFVHSHGQKAVREDFRELVDAECTVLPGVADIIRINHYVTKSYGECAQRRGQPTANLASMNERDMPRFFIGHDANFCEDFRARDLYRSICAGK